MNRALPFAMLLAACQPAADEPPAGNVQPVAPNATIEPLPVAWREMDYPETRECGIVRSADWSARLITTPGQPNRLNVSGTVSTKPTTRLSLRLDPRVMESFPVQRIIHVDSWAPSEPTPDIAEGRTLRGDWAIDGSPGVVTIRCGRTSLATIRHTPPMP